MNEFDPINLAAHALATGSPEAMKTALAPLSDSPDPRATELLVKALAAPSWHVRRLASSILVERGDSMISALENRLPESGQDQAYWICHTLARLGPEADMILMALIKSEVPEHRRYAIHSLARRKGEGAVLALIEALDDPLWANRRRAADVLANRQDKKSTASLIKQDMARGERNRIYWGVRLLATLLGDGSLAIMAKLTGHPDDDVRYLAVESLGGLKSAGAIPSLIKRLSDTNSIVRAKAIEVLGSFGRPAVAPLIEAVRGGDPDQQYTALMTLFQTSPQEALSLASETLDRGKVKSRCAVMKACASHPSPETAHLILKAFLDPVWMVRKTTSTALAETGRRAVVVLRDGLDHESEEVKYWSIATLGKLGPPGLGLLQRLLEKGDRDQKGFAIDAMTEGEPRPEAIQLLIERLDDRCWPLRRQAASALVAAGPVVGPQVIRQVLTPKENIQYWSRQVMREIFGRLIEPLLVYVDEAEVLKADKLLAKLADLPYHELEGMIRADISRLLKSLSG